MDQAWLLRVPVLRQSAGSRCRSQKRLALTALECLQPGPRRMQLGLGTAYVSGSVFCARGFVFVCGARRVGSPVVPLPPASPFGLPLRGKSAAKGGPQGQRCGRRRPHERCFLRRARGMLRNPPRAAAAAHSSGDSAASSPMLISSDSRDGVAPPIAHSTVWRGGACECLCMCACARDRSHFGSRPLTTHALGGSIALGALGPSLDFSRARSPSEATFQERRPPAGAIVTTGVRARKPMGKGRRPPGAESDAMRLARDKKGLKAGAPGSSSRAKLSAPPCVVLCVCVGLSVCARACRCAAFGGGHFSPDARAGRGAREERPPRRCAGRGDLCSCGAGGAGAGAEPSGRRWRGRRRRSRAARGGAQGKVRACAP